jgi:hypothetical protein
MADTNGDDRDRRRNRGRRRPPVIEMTATEVPAEPVQPAAPAPEPTPETTAATVEAAPALGPRAERPPEAEPPAAPAEDMRVEPDIIAPPPPPPEKPGYALPLVAAGLVGALFGAIGGTIVPGLFGRAPTVDPARVQLIEQSVAEIARRPAPALSSVAEVQELGQRLAGVEADVKRRLETHDQKLAAAPTPSAPAAPVNLAPLTDRLNAVDRALAAAGDGLKAVEPQLQQLASRLTQTAQRVEITAAAPLFSATQTLQQAFQRGAPFPGEVAALEALGVKPEQLASLKALAARGAPSVQQLAAAFQPLAAQVARVGQPAATGVQAIIDSVVRTRATGPGAADTPEGLVSIIENALKGGDVSAALAAWARLPEPARKLSEGWAATAQDRAAAEKAIRDLQDSALAALRKAAP